MSEAGNPRSRRNARTGQVADLLDDAPEDEREIEQPLLECAASGI
jgi:hypothetical protein